MRGPISVNEQPVILCNCSEIGLLMRAAFGKQPQCLVGFGGFKYEVQR